MLKKIKDWIGSNLDVYRVTNASDVGAGLVRHEWQGENFATQIGTTLNAQIMNDMQKGLVHNLNSTLVQNIRESIYQTTLDGLDEFEIFDGLKIRLTVDAPNTNAGVKLRLNNVDYTILKEKNGQLGQIETGDFKVNKTYELTYNGSQFIVINLVNTATETNVGVVRYGTTEATALEGAKMAQMMGAEYGGLLQTPGQKEVGKAYYDSVNKQMVSPIEGNNLTYYETRKFMPISDFQNAKKLESLFSLPSNKGVRAFQKESALGNYIDVSNHFSSVDWCLITPWLSGDNDKRYITTYQAHYDGKILYNSTSIDKAKNIDFSYSERPTNIGYYGSCTFLVSGTLK